MHTLDFATLIGAIVTLSGAIVYLWRRQEKEHDERRAELREANKQLHIRNGRVAELEDTVERLLRELGRDSE